MAGDDYRELANVCRRRKLRLLLCSDTDHTRRESVASRLDRLEVRRADELLVRVCMREHNIDSAAAVALTALDDAERAEKK